MKTEQPCPAPDVKDAKEAIKAKALAARQAAAAAASAAQKAAEEAAAAEAMVAAEAETEELAAEKAAQEAQQAAMAVELQPNTQLDHETTEWPVDLEGALPQDSFADSVFGPGPPGFVPNKLLGNYQVRLAANWACVACQGLCLQAWCLLKTSFRYTFHRHLYLHVFE